MSLAEPPVSLWNQHLWFYHRRTLKRVLWWSLHDGLNPHGMEVTAGGITSEWEQGCSEVSQTLSVPSPHAAQGHKEQEMSQSLFCVPRAATCVPFREFLV